MTPKKQPKYNSYTIKHGDTIESIAEKIGIHKDFVIRFHNMYAQQEQLISVEFPVNLKKLYITPEFSEKELDNIPKVNFVYDAKIDWKPSKKLLLYDINFTSTVGEKAIVLTYQMGIQFIEKIQDGFLFEVSKPSPFEEVDNFDIMQELDNKVLDAIYPLQVYVNNLGYCTSVANFETVKKRWESVKLILLDEFIGQHAIDNINFYQSYFENEIQFKKLLENDVFLHVYFAGLYTNYTLGYYYENILDFPVIPNIKTADYKLSNYIEPYLHDSNQVIVERMGMLHDKRAKLDFEQNLSEPYFSLVDDNFEKAEGILNAKYTLDATTHSIKTVKFECTIALEQKRKIKCEIQLVNSN